MTAGANAEHQTDQEWKETRIEAEPTPPPDTMDRDANDQYRTPNLSERTRRTAVGDQSNPRNLGVSPSERSRRRKSTGSLQQTVHEAGQPVRTGIGGEVGQPRRGEHDPARGNRQRATGMKNSWPEELGQTGGRRPKKRHGRSGKGSRGHARPGRQSSPDGCESNRPRGASAQHVRETTDLDADKPPGYELAEIRGCTPSH